MTAVEWLVEQITDGKISAREAIEQAKEMEKEQIMDAFVESRLTHPMIGFKHETFVDYYKQTFKSE